MPGLALLTALGYATPAAAQRGEAHVLQQATGWTPLSGVPGLFDTNTVSRNGVAASLPSTALDLGLTENLSVGTYLLALVPNLASTPALTLKLRYRLYSDGRTTSVLNVLAGGAGGDADVWVALVGMNASYRMSDRHLVTGAFLGGRVLAHVDGDALDLLGALVALSYQATLARWFAVQVTAINLPLLSQSLESDSLLVSVQLNGDVRSLLSRTLVRALLVFRPGNWVLEGGALAGVTRGSEPIPWFNVSKVW